MCNFDCLSCKYSECINDSIITTEELLDSKALDGEIHKERISSIEDSKKKAQAKFRQTPKGKEYVHRMNTNEAGKERFKRYEQSEKGKARRRAYEQTEHRKQYMKEYRARKKKEKEMNNLVNHPSHYNVEGRKECWDEMLELFGADFVVAFDLGSAYKYYYRAGEKDGNPKEQDLAKIKMYMNHARELMNSGASNDIFLEFDYRRLEELMNE